MDLWDIRLINANANDRTFTHQSTAAVTPLTQINIYDNSICTNSIYIWQFNIYMTIQYVWQFNIYDNSMCIWQFNMYMIIQHVYDN